MKKFLALILLATVCLNACREDDITGIVKYCNEVNGHLSSYQRKTIDLTGITTQGGSIVGYFKEKDIVLAIVSSYQEAGRTVAEYYYEDNKLQCVIQQDYTYNKPMYYTDEMAKEDGDTAEHGGYDDSKTVMKTSRFYFYNGNMVKWYDENNKLIPDNNRKYQFQASVLLNESDKLSKMLKAQ